MCDRCLVSYLNLAFHVNACGTYGYHYGFKRYIVTTSLTRVLCGLWKSTAAD
jgi:hypothetical protein